LNKPNKLLLNKEEAADYLGCGKERITTLIKRNQLRVVTVPGGKRLMIPRQEIERWVNSKAGYLNPDPPKRSRGVEMHTHGLPAAELTKIALSRKEKA